MAVSAWTKHLKTDDEKKRYLESLKRASWLIDHIKELIRASADSIEAQELSPKSYDSPNWDYRQAHSNGYKQALKDFNTLLTLDHEDTNGRQPITRGQPTLRTRSNPEQVERQDPTGTAGSESRV